MRRKAADHSGERLNDDDEVVVKSKELVTWRELGSELRAFRLEVRLFILVGLIVTKVHLPGAYTVGSVAAVVGLGALKSFIAR